MKLVRFIGAIAISVAGLSLAGRGLVAQSANHITVPFSDPSRPGTLKVRLVQGALTVRTASGRDVIVDASGGLAQRPERDNNRSQRSDGLRRLSQPTGVTIEEESNVISITARPNDDGRLDIQVPARTNLQLSLVNGGNLVIERVEGDIEANNVNGSIRLTDVAGSVVAHSVNDDVVATVRQVAAQKAMAFTSLNGDVDVTLPASLKANLKLRSDQGDVYTDFDVVTTSSPVSTSQPGQDRGRNNDAAKGKYRLRVDRSIYGTVNGGGPEIELRTFNGDVFLRKGK
jgi:hypothetical protein